MISNALRTCSGKAFEQYFVDRAKNTDGMTKMSGMYAYAKILPHPEIMDE